DVLVGLVDAPRRTLARNAERLASHDGVVLVGPHVELLHLVPVLRLVDRTADVTEARRRVQLEVIRLVVLPVGLGALRRSAAAAAAGHVVADPVAELPVAGEIGMRAEARRRDRLVDRPLGPR